MPPNLQYFTFPGLTYKSVITIKQLEKLKYLKTLNMNLIGKTVNCLTELLINNQINNLYRGDLLSVNTQIFQNIRKLELIKKFFLIYI